MILEKRINEMKLVISEVKGITTAFEGEVQPKFIDSTQGEPKNILEY